MMDAEFKKRLHLYCREQIINRMAIAEHAMAEAQESANSEEKSSAGDKYETGRAMSQITRDMNARQMEVARQDLKELDGILAAQTGDKVQKGSLVIMQNGMMIYVATSLGILAFEQQKVVVVSTKAPIATSLLGKTIGASATVMNTPSVIQLIL